MLQTLRTLIVDGARAIDERRNAWLDERLASGGITSVFGVMQGLVITSIDPDPPAWGECYNRFVVGLQMSNRALFMDALNVDEMVGQVLASEGFAAVEELAYVELDEISSIDGFDEDTAAELVPHGARRSSACGRDHHPSGAVVGAVRRPAVDGVETPGLVTRIAG